MNRIETLQLCLDEIGCPLSAQEVMEGLFVLAQMGALAILDGANVIDQPMTAEACFWLSEMYLELDGVGR